ncbi:MAG: hypothetical protein MK089_00125 [Phycisphaerales bacterium]|nr:hypothetical protein [Phycisphaerales bacterium]
MLMTSCLVLSLALAVQVEIPQEQPDTLAPSAETVPESTDSTAQRSTADALQSLQGEGLSEKSEPDALWDQLLKTTATLIAQQQELARTRLELSGIKRELADLRQFILDHDTYGSDFSSYTKMLEETRRQKRAAAAKAQREKEAAERKRREENRKRLDAAKGRKQLEKLYDDRGFAPIGQDVYSSRAAFFYGPRTGEDGKTIQYRPDRFGRLTPVTVSNQSELDYSMMTISGSVLNGSKSIRSIGVAYTFFDENGNQVGAEIVEIQNARPNVPYPFTKKIDMALNRPFASHSTYVLYADVAATP